MLQLNRKFKDLIKNMYCEISKKPIIVTGNQKSGTSVIASLLADYGYLSKTIDIPILWNENVKNILNNNVSFADLVYKNKKYFINDLIKEPNMIFFIDQVIKFFPKAQYIYIVRNPLDNIRSILNRLKIHGNLKNINIPYRNKYSKIEYLLDTNLWGGENENYIGILAHRWNFAVDNYIKHCDKFFVIRYEDFIKDKVNFIDSTAHKLNLYKYTNVMPNVEFQYQPKGDSDVDLINFYGRENYDKIINICESRMQFFDYHI